MRRREAMQGGFPILAAMVVGALIPADHAVSQTAEAPTVSVDSRGSEARVILDSLDRYIGRWRTEEKEGPRGGSFHFEYDLRWMDEGRTIARMVIERVPVDGVRAVVFEGYKGRRPSGEEVYYFAASPSGRASEGRVILEGEDVVTLYDGWTADGAVVEIRDVFGPVDGDAFVSRTFLRSSPDEEWRQIGEDRWRRLGDDGARGGGSRPVPGPGPR